MARPRRRITDDDDDDDDDERLYHDHNACEHRRLLFILNRFFLSLLLLLHRSILSTYFGETTVAVLSTARNAAPRERRRMVRHRTEFCRVVVFIKRQRSQKMLAKTNTVDSVVSLRARASSNVLFFTMRISLFRNVVKVNTAFKSRLSSRRPPILRRGLSLSSVSSSSSFGSRGLCFCTASSRRRRCV